MESQTLHKPTKEPTKNKKPAGIEQLYKTPGVLQEKINEFFELCIEGTERPVIAGLTMFLGFANNNWIQNYGKRSKGFKCVVSRARTKIEYEQCKTLTNPDSKNSNGAWRYLQAAFKYSEKVETKHLGNAPRTILYPVKATVGADIVTKKPVKKKVAKKKK